MEIIQTSLSGPALGGAGATSKVYSLQFSVKNAEYCVFFKDRYSITQAH